MQSEIIDLNTIANLLELDDPTEPTSFFVDLVREFFIQATRLIALIRQAIQQNDQLTIFMHLHNLKGASLNMGAIALAQRCETMEDHLQASNLSKMQSWMAEVELTYHETAQALQLKTEDNLQRAKMMAD